MRRMNFSRISPEVTIKLFRDGKPMEKKLSLRARKEENVAVKDSRENDGDTDTDREESPKSMKLETLGMSVKPLSSEEKRKAKVENGVVVTDVKRYSEAYNRGVAEEDIILEADKEKLSTPKDLKSIVEKHKAGDALLLRVKRGNNINFVAVQIPK